MLDDFYTMIELNEQVYHIELHRYPTDEEAHLYTHTIKEMMRHMPDDKPLYLVHNFNRAIFRTVSMLRSFAKLFSDPRLAASIGYCSSAEVKGVFAGLFDKFASEQPDEVPPEMEPDVEAAFALLEKLAPSILDGVDWRVKLGV